MIIEEADFRLIQSGDNSIFWDLELLNTVKNRSGQEREEFKNAGYGMTLEFCIKKIINFRIGKSQEVLSLQEYLKEYKKQSEIINKLFKDL